MKKILLTTIFSVFYMASASAELGVNIGIAGSAGVFTASATESVAGGGAGAKTNKGTESGEAGWSSYFIEKTLGPILMIGYEYSPDSMDSDTVETAKIDKTDDSTTSTVSTNTVKVTFENITSAYVGVRYEGFYAKAGTVSVDLLTKENLETGSTYGNATIDGTMMGFGHNKTFGNGVFVRAEGVYMDFDSLSLTSSANGNVIKMGNLDGVSAKLAVGKSF
jgi:hypothetical protein